MNGGVGVIPSLIKGLDDTSAEVRRMSTWVLRQLSHQFKLIPHEMIAREIARRLRSETDERTKMEMISSLQDYACPTAVRELKHYSTDDPSSRVRKHATHLVARAAQDPANEIDFFHKQRGDKSLAVQLAADYELTLMGEKHGHALALRTMKNSPYDWDEQTEAFMVLGANGEAADLPFLQNIWRSTEEDGWRRVAALDAYREVQLAQVPPAQRLDYLIKMLDDPSEPEREWAAYYHLWNYSDPNTSARLKKYLDEKGHLGYAQASNALSLRK